MGARFEVAWTGPGASDDYITVARSNQPPGAYVSMTRIREGNPVKIWAPSDPGDYVVRYVLARGAKVLASVSITVNPVTAAVQAAGPAKVADWIEVSWEGPAGEGDFVSVARPEQAPGASVSLVRVKEGNPVRLRAPSDPGDYEVRYILGRGNKLLARAPVTIEPVVAALEAPATAVAGAEFEVHWTGPGYPEDFIAIARSNQPTTANLGARPTRLGNPVKIKAPKEPGVYELRYILGRGNRLLGRATITISAP
jgi:Ca-activated chloride channel family protein